MTPTDNGFTVAVPSANDPAVKDSESSSPATPMTGVDTTSTTAIADPDTAIEEAPDPMVRAMENSRIAPEVGSETHGSHSTMSDVPSATSLSTDQISLKPESHVSEGSTGSRSPMMQQRQFNDATPSGEDSPSNSTAATGLQSQPEFINGRSTRTGYVYDVRMRFHSNVHGEDDHPEDPRRIWRIYDALKTAHCTDRMVKIVSREATVEELSLVHTQDHINNITKTMSMSKEDLLDMANNYNSIYLNNSSAFCARLSCGSLLELCKAVATGEVLNGVAIVRPPGHHAEPDEAGGFCLYNNVAIAARYLQKNFGLRKIFILDWDVHHGNGTQKAFIDDPDVVYCSIHRYENGTFYPGDPVAASHETVGEGAGRGKTINIPWPTSGMGDSEYIYTFHKVILPIIYEFAPDFILVSAGFDAAKGDHIGENLVTPAAYGHMTHMLKSLAGGKIILALEGGYNLDSIAVSGLACTKALLNDPIDALEPIIPNAACVQTIHEVMEVQSRYWRSLTPMYLDPLENEAAKESIVKLSQVLSVYHTEFLYEKHNMLNMPIANTSHGEDFLSNVHCTQDLYSTQPLYIFVHNLGEFCARTVGISNVIRPEKSVLVDSVAQYVDKIVKSGNQLIDIVVPYHPATEEDKGPLKEKIAALLADIWDNFVFMAENTRRIVLLASGFGCHGMVAFMNERQKEVTRYVSCVVLIPGGEEPLPMVTKRLSSWYMDNSFVVVADDHPIWERANQKANNRVGNLVRSGRPVERLSESLLHLFTTTFDEIDKKLSHLPPLQVPMEIEEEEAPSGNSTNPSSSSKEEPNGSGPQGDSRQGQQDGGAGIPSTLVHPPHPSESYASGPGQYPQSSQPTSRLPAGHAQSGQQSLNSRGGSAHSSAPHSPVSGPSVPVFQQQPQQQQPQQQHQQLPPPPPQQQQQQQQHHQNQYQQHHQQQPQQRTPSSSNFSLVDRPSVGNLKQQRTQPYPAQNGASGNPMSRGPSTPNPSHGASSPTGAHGVTGRINDPYAHGYDPRPPAGPGPGPGLGPVDNVKQPQQHVGYQGYNSSMEAGRSDGYVSQASKGSGQGQPQGRPGGMNGGGGGNSSTSSPTTSSGSSLGYPTSGHSAGVSSGAPASSSPHGGYARQHEQIYPPRSQGMSSQHQQHAQPPSHQQQQQHQHAMRQQQQQQQQQQLLQQQQQQQQQAQHKRV
ncbi:Histone deacetylase hda1 [Podila epigama]|nr:Histone deacetylase hda1 [Podila epigama]